MENSATLYDASKHGNELALCGVVHVLGFAGAGAAVGFRKCCYGRHDWRLSGFGWVMSTKTKTSPCVGICVLDKERVRCIGCGRTIEEIINRGKKWQDQE